MVSNSKTEAEEPESGHPAFSRLSILRAIWKKKALIAVVWVLCAIAAITGVHFWPSIFLSEAVVLVDSQQIPEKFVSPTVASDVDERIASIRQTLLGGGELRKIIDDFGMFREERKTRFEEEILEEMRRNISISPESLDPASASADSARKSNATQNKHTIAFWIGYQGPDPVLATRVANRLTDDCIEQNLRMRELQAAGTSDFLDSQLVEAKKQLDDLEAAVSSYKVKHSGELPQQAQELESALSRLQTELEANRDAINRAQQTRVILEGNLNTMQVTLTTQERALEQARRANESDGSAPLTGQGAPAKRTSDLLQEQLELLRLRYSESHPDVIRLRKMIEEAKRSENQQHEAASGEAAKSEEPKPGAARDLPPRPEEAEILRMREQVGSLKAQISGSDKELESRKAEQQRILGEISQLQGRVDRLPLREQEFARVTRDYEIARENYKSLLDKKTAAEMALQMERGQQSERFTVLDRAQVPERPIRPKKNLLYAAAPVAALIMALLVGFVSELRRNVVLGEWELPEGTTVLARLPYIEIKPSSSQEEPPGGGLLSRRKTLVKASVTGVLVTLAASAFWNLFLHRF